MVTIRTKMIFTSLAMFVLAGGAAGAGIWGSTTLTNNVDTVARTAEILRNHMQADMMHDALRADVLSALMARNAQGEISTADVTSDLKEHVESFRKAINDNKALVTDPEIQAVLKNLDTPLRGYIDNASAIVAQAASNPDQALLSLPAFQQQFSILETAMEKAGDSISSLSDGVKLNSDRLAVLIDTILKTVLAATAVSALVLLFVSRKTIIQPIRFLAGDMQKLVGGNTALSITGINRTDEIGEMATAVEVFRQAAITNKRLEAEAIAARERNEADRIRVTREAEAAARVMLHEATSSLAGGLRKLAAGDLSFHLSDAFAPDFEALRHDLNTAVHQLDQTLTTVAQAAGSIDTGTREISISSDDLSKRTEQQAASLEETAAALDQITINVANASKRADEARAIAIQANASATQSGIVVASAVDAMQRIEESSGQISSIIGVIDEIAFQTNLLALNAGVEAARAGEAGKGFAVVAQEVRELAQRSARAAKEIKELIRNSTTEVESGVKLVRETGGSLKVIGDYIITINQHMDAIATSSREQSVGLAEVNTAVNQMDQVTQRNAAMVEETSAASASLATESHRLHELISQFTLGRPAARQHDKTRRAA